MHEKIAAFLQTNLFYWIIRTCITPSGIIHYTRIYYLYREMGNFVHMHQVFTCFKY